MKTVLAAAAIIGLSVSGAFAACGGHDMVMSEKADKVAKLDMSTTASTTADAKVEVEKEAPAETE